MPWSQLGPDFVHSWGYPRGERMPEHVEILGQTGSGKSFFEKTILLQRVAARGSHVVVIATKPADQTILSTGWPVITKWPPPYGKNQVVFHAASRGLGKETQAQQRATILALLNQLWKPESNTVVVFDEIAYLASDLGLKVELTTYFREARSLGITIVSSTQRPQGVPRWMHSEAGWTVCFAPKDEEDAERMAQILGGKKTYMPVLKTLNRAKYEFLIVHGLTGEAVISWIDRAPKRPKDQQDRNGSEKRTA